MAATAVPPAAAPPRQPQATVLPSHAGPATLLVPDATTGSPVQHLGDIGGKDVGTSGPHLVDRGAATPAAVEQPPQQQLQEQEQEHHQQQPPSSSAGGRQALLEESNVRGSLEAEVAAALRALPDHAQAGALPPPQLATARASPHCTGHFRAPAAAEPQQHCVPSPSLPCSSGGFRQRRRRGRGAHRCRRRRQGSGR